MIQFIKSFVYLIATRWRPRLANHVDKDSARGKKNCRPPLAHGDWSILEHTNFFLLRRANRDAVIAIEKHDEAVHLGTNLEYFGPLYPLVS